MDWRPTRCSPIAADRLGNIYFTTGYAYGLAELPNTAGNGISRWDHRAFATFNKANTSGGLPSNTVHASLYDSANDVIWFGTDKGLARFNPNTTVFTLIVSLAGVNVRDLRLDAAGNLWVATLGQGVYKLRSLDGAQLAQYTVAGGQLPSNQVTSLAIDGLNQLWVGTNGGGLCRFNLSSSSWTSISDSYVSGDGPAFSTWRPTLPTISGSGSPSTGLCGGRPSAWTQISRPEPVIWKWRGAQPRLHHLSRRGQ